MKKRAFTMVELIFVIVILGILAAVAVPRLNASRADAKLTKYVTDVVTIMRDVRSYYAAVGATYEMRSVSVADEPNVESACKEIMQNNPLALASWDGTTCTLRKNTDDITPIGHATNVQLLQGYRESVLMVGEVGCISFSAGYLRADHAQLGDENYFMVGTSFHPDADASGGDEALCKRLLAHPAVKAALTNEKGDTLGVRGFVLENADHTSAACPADKVHCKIDFNFAGSGVNFD